MLLRTGKSYASTCPTYFPPGCRQNGRSKQITVGNLQVRQAHYIKTLSLGNDADADLDPWVGSCMQGDGAKLQAPTWRASYGKGEFKGEQAKIPAGAYSIRPPGQASSKNIAQVPVKKANKHQEQGYSDNSPSNDVQMHPNPDPVLSGSGLQAFPQAARGQPAGQDDHPSEGARKGSSHDHLEKTGQDISTVVQWQGSQAHAHGIEKVVATTASSQAPSHSPVLEKGSASPLHPSGSADTLPSSSDSPLRNVGGGPLHSEVARSASGSGRGRTSADAAGSDKERYLEAYIGGNPESGKIYSKPKLRGVPGELSDEHLKYFEQRGERSLTWSPRH